jgi:uncharacterized iron-regulated membrane protein
LKLIFNFIFNFMPMPAHVPDPGASPRPRAWLFRLHLLVGLTTGLLLALMGVSGSLLVFRPELEAASLPRATTATQAGPPLQVAVDNALASEPGRLAVLRMPESAGSPLLIQIVTPDRGPRRLFLDPGTGRVIGRDDPAGGFLGLVHDFHHDLFAGRNGRLVTGIAGWLLTGLCLSGVALWWPGRGRVAAKATMFRHATLRRRRAWTVHNTLGIASATLLGVIACTATYFTWREGYTRALLALTRQGDPPRPPAAALEVGSVWAPADRFLLAAQAAWPAAQVTTIRYPLRAGEPVSVRMRGPGDWRHVGSDVVYLHPVTAQVLRVDTWAAKPWALRILDRFPPLHSGEAGGWPLRVLWALLGLAPAGLFFTGFRLWWKRTLSRSEPRYQPSLVAASAADLREPA